MQLPKRKAEILREQTRTTDNYLTPAAITRAQEDLERLTKVERPAAVAEVRRTQEMGDLSENAAYQEAKYRLRRINGRILNLTEQLKTAIPIQAGSADGIVRIGSKVTFELDGKDLAYEILGTRESNPARGRISYVSPLGAALLGQRAGDHGEVKLGERVVHFRIIGIS
jgi:transcription elongation GreA/GreB family factor